MNITGIIMECNPFHQGHRYILEEARKQTAADYLIAVISGDFMQRGIPAVLSKHERAGLLLQNGADLVLEIPVRYACGAADHFAAGGITLLNRLGVVTDLCFGSESGSLSQILSTAELLADEPPCYRTALQEQLRRGLSFPAARSAALRAILPHACADNAPNDLLGVEYCKQLIRQKSSIRPHTVPRIRTASASSLRQALEDISAGTDSADFQTSGLSADIFLQQGLPPETLLLLEQDGCIRPPVTAEIFSSALLYALRMEQELCIYQDVSPTLSNRIRKELPGFTGWNNFCSRLKTKELTYTRISRSLLHILLRIRSDRMNEGLAAGTIGYARVLGLRTAASPLFHCIKEKSDIPLLTQPLHGKKILSPPFRVMLEEDIRCAELYDHIAALHFQQKETIPAEYEKEIVRI